MRRLAVLLACLMCAVASSARATNNYFLPGDAFFPTELTAEVLTRLQAAKPGEYPFVYSNFGAYPGAFCGYAGYHKARIPAVDRAFAANLAKAYAELRIPYRKELTEFEDEGKTELRETNGLRVMFYPEKFAFPRFKLGLQYNENWVAEAEKFGHRAEHLRLGELVDSKDAIIQSWRDSTRVGTFDVTLPKLAPELEIQDWDPIKIKGAVKAIVVPALPLEKFFHPPEKHFLAPVYVVDAKGIERYDFDAKERVWKKVEKESE